MKETLELLLTPGVLALGITMLAIRSLGGAVRSD